MFPLICAWINGWVNNGEAGDLRRHRNHYDITVMLVTSAVVTSDDKVGIMTTLSFHVSKEMGMHIYKICKHPIMAIMPVPWNRLLRFSRFIRKNLVLCNTLRPRQNGRHFADEIFKCILLNESAWISINISLKFAPKCQIKNIPAMVQIMAWRQPGDKPSPGPMIFNLLTHICATWPQWDNEQRCISVCLFVSLFISLPDCLT